MNKKANNNELKKQNTELETQLKVQKKEFEKEIKELTKIQKIGWNHKF